MARLKQEAAYGAGRNECRRTFLFQAAAVVVAPDWIRTNRRTDMPLTLQDIADRFEIQDLLARYCFAVDDRDWNAYRAVFTPDAVIDDTVTGGVRSGVEDHVTYLKRALSKISLSQHSITTQLLDIKKNEATARVACICPLVVDLGGGKSQVFFMGVWYRDKLVRTSSGWRLSELLEEGVWSHNVPTGFKF